MPKMRNRGRALPYPVMFSGYTVLACLVLMVFRYIVPLVPAPLPIYRLGWRLINGVLDICRFFPSIALAGLIIPFGFGKQYDEAFPRFSPRFFAAIRPAIVTAIAGAAVYGALFFLVLPLSQTYKGTLIFNGDLFNKSRESALQDVGMERWITAEKSIAVCRRIWPHNQEVIQLVEQIRIKASEVRINNANARAEKLYHIEKVEKEAAEGIAGNSALRTPLNVASAIADAQSALREKRYYDAHWLATVGIQLAKAGSPEARTATRIAAEAWTALDSLAPTEREQEAYALYRQKRDGYIAINDEDWLRAYAIFNDLFTKTPGDPDVANFLAVSKEKAESLAFFTNERDVALGEIIPQTLFSLPLAAFPDVGTRVVIRFTSLSVFADASYGSDVSVAAFDREGRLLQQARAPYGKLRPQRTNEGEQLLLMLRAIDQEEQVQYDPVLSGNSAGQGPFTNAQLMLNITYNDFLLLSKTRRGIDALLIGELFRASQHFGSYGFAPQVFQADIIYRISESAGFLALAILIIIVGWRFRAKKRPSFLGLPMLIILPFAFEGIVYLYRSVLNTLSIWTVTSLGFTVSIILFSAATVICFFFALLLLAGQREN